MNNKQATCDERIDAELRKEVDRIKELVPDGAEWYRCEECEHVFTSDEDGLPDCPECGERYKIESGVDPDEDAETVDGYMENLLDFRKVHEVYRVQLSTGGPGDDFWLYVDPEDREIERIEYAFLDWFDGARRELRGEDFEVVKGFFEGWVEEY